jgi:hypothetical protein
MSHTLSFGQSPRKTSDPPKPTGKVLLEGVFKKMGISKTNSWKKRHFALREDGLARLRLDYFEKAGASKVGVVGVVVCA